jgi:hypothetical protein
MWVRYWKLHRLTLTFTKPLSHQCTCQNGKKEVNLKHSPGVTILFVRKLQSFMNYLCINGTVQHYIKIILVNANFLAQPHKHIVYSYCIDKVWKPLH